MWIVSRFVMWNECFSYGKGIDGYGIIPWDYYLDSIMQKLDALVIGTWCSLHIMKPWLP